MAAGKSGDAEQAFLLLLLLGLGFGSLGWFIGRDVILEGLRWLRVGEMALIAPLAYLFGQGADWNEGWRWLLDSPASASGAARENMFSVIEVTGTYVGLTLRWPMAAFFLVVAWWYYKFNPFAKFRQKHNLASLMKVQAISWPVITPVIKINPIEISARIPGEEVPSRLPLFAESLTPEEWIAWARIPMSKSGPDREALRQAFSAQLGPVWAGPENQPAYVRALFAAFALKGAQKRKESDVMLGEISKCWDPKAGLRLTSKLTAQVNEIIADPKIGGVAKKKAEQHAFRATALMGLLAYARHRGGVLAPAQFLWLRGQDRALWYPLNNTGRRTWHAEAAGAGAHYMAELQAKRGLSLPRVDTAIMTIVTNLSSRNVVIPDLKETA